MRFLSISVLFALVAACGSSPVKGLAETTVETPVFRSTYFDDPAADYVYKANVTVYGHELSGIFVAKKKDDGHRVVLTTEFGNKLIDIDLKETDYTVNAIVDELDRKILLETLVADFRLMLRKEHHIAAQFDAPQAKILKATDGKKVNYLYLSTIDGKLLQIKHAGKRKETITFRFHAENPTFAEDIFIEHHDIKLKMVFKQLKNQ